MTVEITTGHLTTADLQRLAELHRVCLPRSVLSVLGPTTVLRYYEYVAASRTEAIAVARVDGLVQGGVVVSHAPETLLRRFATHAPVSISFGLARQLATNRDLRHRLRRRLAERESTPLDIPEVTQIFTDPALRSRGIGSLLLRSTEDTLRRAKTPAYCIHTNADDNEAGIRFYQREGFATVGETRSFGDRFLVMTKGLE